MDLWREGTEDAQDVRRSLAPFLCPADRATAWTMGRARGAAARPSRDPNGARRVNAGAKLHRLAGGKMHQRGGGEAPEDGFVWRALRLGWIVGRRVGVVAA